jgi:hypothetical protein
MTDQMYHFHYSVVQSGNLAPGATVARAMLPQMWKGRGILSSTIGGFVRPSCLESGLLTPFNSRFLKQSTKKFIQTVYIRVRTRQENSFNVSFERIRFVVGFNSEFRFLLVEDAPVPKSEPYRPDNATNEPCKSSTKS